ncbi:hypothetical protein GWI33_016856 [Rhynchophorus ferrugineus]|uniref:Uncharacterized protein n=1 Tax=Rhynchophorus ferrugineus TaxID=354439 RepID=A0A834M6R8_RHYFE|nr:hypothetical protein GWI33_016856 [Rhynchophorus ferrugineus]
MHRRGIRPSGASHPMHICPVQSSKLFSGVAFGQDTRERKKKRESERGNERKKDPFDLNPLKDGYKWQQCSWDVVGIME